MEKVRFGIIGLGKIAARFARVLSASKSGRLYAAAARDAARAKSFAAEYGAEKSFGSYEQLLQDPQVELIYIALPHHLHYKFIRRCLQSGKGVLCEKPMVLCGEQAQTLCALAQEKQLLLMEAMWTRCLPVNRRVAGWIQAGRIGEAKLLQASFCHKAPFDPHSRLFNPALAGGALYDVGVYPLMFAMDMLGGPPCEVTGAAEICPTGVDVCNTLSLRFPGGALASIQSGSTVSLPSDAVIYGTGGHIFIPDFYRAESAQLYDGAGALREHYEARCPDGFIYEIDHAAELFRAGALESPLVPWRDTIACASILSELREKWEIAGDWGKEA